MNFETLGNFEWYNEPENVRFETENMIIFAKAHTDFWQSIHRGFKKDDGHFFFSRQKGDFLLTVKWQFDVLERFSQCGLMVRSDERNWLKVSLMNETSEDDVLGVSLTINGHSDWSGFHLNQEVHELWLRLQRVGDDYILFYSLDGVAYNKLKMFYLKSYDDIKAGAYIASPNQEGFAAALCNINFGI
ncbi:MAG: DUF1349 domain-containing protein [Alphaproteobacteria bacterium]|nr:DUF1349 domain-containing protein [Alphaproteobacteria bacterium]